MSASSHYPATELSRNVRAFCETLRLDHDFKLGPGEIADALRALEVVGVTNPDRACDALRLVCCARLEDTAVFDRAFQNFFFPRPSGVPQENQPPLEPERPKRPNNTRAEDAKNKTDEKAQAEHGDQDDEDFEGAAAQRTPDEHDENAVPSEGVTRAKYSAATGESERLEIARDGLESMLRAASSFVSRLRLGRSRKWRTTPRGSRFDFRRTMRSSLSTGGDAMHPRWLGHPRRNPRVVLLLDGSRSMLEHSMGVVQFAFALSQRSRRVDVFTFSTELQDVTRDLKRLAQDGLKQDLRNRPNSLEHVEDRLGFTLHDLKHAWGGGTRIGESLTRFVRDHAHRVLTPDTLVIVSSDGLDVGEVDALERAMREIKRRSAGVIWLNPLAAQPGYQPSARGMKAALPHVQTLTHADTPEAFSRLADQVGRHS